MVETCICIQVCVYVAFVIATVVTAIPVSEENANEEELSCPGPVTYYTDLGCTPVYRDTPTKHCAIKYDCDHVKKRDKKNKCYYNNREYNLDDYLTERNEVDPNVAKIKECAICRCRKGPHDEIAAFECQDEGCPKYPKPPKDGCYMRGDPRRCCYNKKEICPKPGEKIFTCATNPIAVNGSLINSTYLDGDIFNVNGEPELICICQPGYEGKNISPFCVRRSLSSSCMHLSFSHIDYFHKNCAPVYIFESDNNCYIKMKCQEYSDVFIPHIINYVPSLTDYTNERVCLLGNLSLKIGDRLRPFTDNIYPNGCIDCICETPPTLSCEYLSPDRCDNLNSFLDSINFLG